jgi:Flp pilus assembly protein TadG
MTRQTTARGRRGWRRPATFARDVRGTTAIEFGLVGAPFLFLICAILDAGVLYFNQESLNNAVDRASREMLTGAFHAAADKTDPATRFRKLICVQQVNFDCAKLKVEVTTSATYGSASPSPPYDPSKQTFAKDFGARFSCPKGSEVVTIRAAVPAPRIFALMDMTGRPLASGGQLITTTRIAQTEAYGTKGCQT